MQESLHMTHVHKMEILRMLRVTGGTRVEQAHSLLVGTCVELSPLTIT